MRGKGPRAFRDAVVSGMSAAFCLRLLAGPSDGFDRGSLSSRLQTRVDRMSGILFLCARPACALVGDARDRVRAASGHP